MILQFLCAMLLAFGFFTQPDAKTEQLSPQQVPAAQNLRVSGTVVDALTGQPLSQAQVFLTAQGVRDSEQFVLTGEDGRFAFENLAPGHYVLFGNHKGYVQQVYKQHAQFSTAIIVGPDLVTDNLRFELRPTAPSPARYWMNEKSRYAMRRPYFFTRPYVLGGTQPGGSARSPRMIGATIALAT